MYPSRTRGLLSVPETDNESLKKGRLLKHSLQTGEGAMRVLPRIPRRGVLTRLGLAKRRPAHWGLGVSSTAGAEGAEERHPIRTTPGFLVDD
jgi:hypothetical protein